MKIKYELKKIVGEIELNEEDIQDFDYDESGDDLEEYIRDTIKDEILFVLDENLTKKRVKE